MPVNSTHPKYDATKLKWKVVRDCVAGQEAMQKGDYLPKFDPPDEKRDEAYVARALYVNVTGRTLNSLVGAVFRKDMAVDVPPDVEYIDTNADSAGNSLEQFSKDLVSNLVSVGRHGILTDYPDVVGTPTAEEVALAGLRPYLSSYTAESIINWHTDNNGRLDLVVLQESVEDSEDEFSAVDVNQFRVLRLRNKVYTQQLYDKDLQPVTEEMTPRKADGSTWSEIPFIITGSVNNDPNIDPVTLYDLAVVNVAHFRNSADYEEGVFLHGQPMLHIDTGTMSADEWKQLNPNGVSVGARRGVVTAGGGAAELMQAESNGAAFEAMKHKEDQMVQIGARLVERGGSNQTAEAVRTESAAEHSVLETLVTNAQDAIVRAVRWCVEFAGGDPAAVDIKLNDDFFDTPPDATMLAQLMGLESSGIISKPVIIAYLRRTGVVPDDMTDEDILNSISNSGPGA